MSQLAITLQSYGIDSSSLNLVVSRGDEQIYQLLAPTHEAINRWQTLRRLVEKTGYWPVVGWGSRWMDEAPEYRAHLTSGSTAEILAESEQVDFDRWRQARRADIIEMLNEVDAAEGETVDDLFYDVHGDWPEGIKPDTSFESLKFFLRGDVPRAPIALVPTSHGWQVPAVLRLDTFYAPTAVHVAALRRWSAVYGAELVCLLPDTIEMRVERPPTTRSAALALAEEQYVYCEDIVIQGVQTIERLAAVLLNSPVWFFWWD
jgi:hypothetical protein